MKVDIREVPDVCKYCRKLIKEEGYPKVIYLYREEMLCLTVDVEKMSKLSLDQDTLRYKKYDEKEVERLNHLNRSKKTPGLPH